MNSVGEIIDFGYGLEDVRRVEFGGRCDRGTCQ